MKIRSCYVSNSSSSSYVIACKGIELTNKVLEAYNKLVDFWKETHTDFDISFFDTYYVEKSAKDLINDFSEYFSFTEFEKKYLLKDWEEKEKNGYFLLYGSCSNESDMNGYLIMNMFNEYILNSLKDGNGQYEDLEIIFDRRGS